MLSFNTAGTYAAKMGGMPKAEGQKGAGFLLPELCQLERRCHAMLKVDTNALEVELLAMVLWESPE